MEYPSSGWHPAREPTRTYQLLIQPQTQATIQCPSHRLGMLAGQRQPLVSQLRKESGLPTRTAPHRRRREGTPITSDKARRTPPNTKGTQLEESQYNIQDQWHPRARRNIPRRSLRMPLAGKRMRQGYRRHSLAPAQHRDNTQRVPRTQFPQEHGQRIRGTRKHINPGSHLRPM